MQNYIWIFFKITGAVGLLIYGMRMMSVALQKMTGPQLRHILGAMTTNRFTGMLTGTFITCIVQSSSATTVMTVSFVSAGLLTLAQAISVIMGANIGTTLTAWIISMGYNVDLSNFVYPAFLIGMILIYKKKNRFAGDLLFGAAFMFLSLVMLHDAGQEMDLENNKDVVDFFASFDTNKYSTIFSFLAIGTLITCVLQSSAAVMAITIMLCSTGVLPIHLGIALVMGENIGTTATANLAALGAGTEARRAALAHLMFNVFGVIWVLCVFYQFTDMVCTLVGYDTSAAPQAAKLPVVLAMFHTCFNVTNTALLISFIPQIEHVVCWMLPEKKEKPQEEFKLKYIESNLIQTPEISVLQAQKEVALFAGRTQRMFSMMETLLGEDDDEKAEDLYKQIENQEILTDRTEIEIAQYLERVSENHLSDSTKEKVRIMMREIGELESIGDACYNISRIANRRSEIGRGFNESQLRQLHALILLAGEALSLMKLTVEGHHKEHSTADTLRLDKDIRHMCERLKDDNIRAVNDRQCDYNVGSMFLDVVGEFEKLSSYIVNVVEARTGNKPSRTPRKPSQA